MAKNRTRTGALPSEIAKGESLDGIEMLKKVTTTGSGFISKIIAWWAIGEMAWSILNKVASFLSKKEEDSHMLFRVEDGTAEHAALMAMAAIYIDKDNAIGSVFKLEKKEKGGKYKPAGDCKLNFKNELIFISKSDNEASLRARDSWIVKVPISVLDDFLKEFDSYVDLSGNTSHGIYRWSGWSWRRVASMPENRVVILPDGQMEFVINDAKRFLEAGDWYNKKGIPWRKGYEFFGLPGTGKTTMAICLSMNLNKSLHCISSKECSGSTFEDALRELPGGAIVLIEDIDCIFDTSLTNRNSKAKAGDPIGVDSDSEENRMTLSDFLNAIDGVTSHKEGRILILTTNHDDRLDPAIIRPGRIDMRVEFKHADKYQLRMLSKRMLGEKEGEDYFNKNFRNNNLNITMAEAENILLPVALDQIREQTGG